MANVDVTIQPDQEISEEEVLDVKQRNPIKFVFSWIWILIKIPLYPFIWVLKEMGRLWQFLSGGKEVKDRPLDYEEIIFVESFPAFLIITGGAIATILGVIAYIGFSDQVDTFFDNLTKGFDGYVQVIKDIYGGIIDILTYISIDLFWNGIRRAIWVTFEDLFLADPIMVLVIISVVLVVGFFLIAIISEIGLVEKIVRKLGYVGLGLTDLPRAIYHTFDKVWTRFIKWYGRRVVGPFITDRSRGFYQRILWIVTVYAIWTFVWGIILLGFKLADPAEAALLKEDQTELVQTILYIILVLILSGFFAGTLLVFILSRLLNGKSASKYTPEDSIIDQVRHDSLLRYVLSKSKGFPALELATVSRVVDIPQEDFVRHFKDNQFADWKLYSNHMVNHKLYSERLAKIDEWEDEGLENEDTKPLVKAVDFVAYMLKGLQNVPEVVEELEERKEILFEDIADLSGYLDEETASDEEQEEN
ncbi:MAG: hypothetical protein ACXAC7_07055 [Candidatus Hodarchaeales archaeon]|jgi:hypothetical protein